MQKTILLSFIGTVLAQEAFPAYPLFDAPLIGTPSWTTLFLTGANIPNMPPKPITSLSSIGAYHSTCGVQDRWALTFDDGPAQNSKSVADNLRANKLPATFFVIARQVPAYIPYLKTIAQDPLFEIAMHTFSHKYLFNLSNDEIVGQVVWSAKIIYDAIGLVPRYLRPPYGSTDERVLAVLAAMDVVVIGWSIDNNDWRLDDTPASLTPQALSTAWSASLNAPNPNGAISLQHDFFSGAATAGINTLIPAFQRSTKTAVKMSDCLASANLGPAYATSGKLFNLVTSRAAKAVTMPVVPAGLVNVIPSVVTDGGVTNPVIRNNSTVIINTNATTTANKTATPTTTANSGLPTTNAKSSAMQTASSVLICLALMVICSQ